MPIGCRLSLKEQEAAVNAYLRGGTYRSAKGTTRGTVYGIIRRNPKLYERLKEKYRGEIARKELKISLSAKLSLKKFLPLLKTSGVTATLALYLLHRNELHEPASFKAFCAEKLTKSREAGYRRLTFAKTYLDLLGTALARGDVRAQEIVRGMKEAHVRELIKLGSDKKRYSAVLEGFAKVDGDPTAGTVREAVQKKDSTIPLPRESITVRFRSALLKARTRIRKLRVHLAQDTSTTTQLEAIDAIITRALG